MTHWLAPLLGIILIVGLLPAVTGAAHATPSQTNPCVGTITSPPDGVTIIAIQGARFKDGESLKTPGLLVSVAPNGAIRAVRNNSARGRWWTYDVDPLPNGNLLLAATEPGISVVEAIDPSTGDPLTVLRFPTVKDAHDVDYIGNNEYALVDKGERSDRVLVYDRSATRFVWQWRFEDYYPHSGGGPYPDDWTHVNDVDAIDEDRFLVSVRNFDQVIIVNRSTNEIEGRLGRDDRHEILHEQHNPQYLTGESDPAILVADSRNDRVIEYARVDGEWEPSWILVGGGLDEPRDADRLPNGNTLVVDRHGQRTLEVAPNGTVLWEFYSPWQPYDAERYRYGDEPDGPTMRDLGMAGQVELTGSTRFTTTEIEACSDTLTSFTGNGSLVSSREIDAVTNQEVNTIRTIHRPQTPHTSSGNATPLIIGVVVGVLTLVIAAGYSRR